MVDEKREMNVRNLMEECIYCSQIHHGIIMGSFLCKYTCECGMGMRLRSM